MTLLPRRTLEWMLKMKTVHLQLFNKSKLRNLKRFLVVQNFSKTLRIGFTSFNMSSLDKDC